MFPFHHIEFDVFCQATEDMDRVVQALRFFVGDSELMEDCLEGFCGNPLTRLTGRLEKRDEMEGFWRKVVSAGLLEWVLSELDKRTDEQCNLYIRFSKQMAYKGQLVAGVAGRAGGVIEMRAKVAAYPAKKSVAVKRVDEYLRSLTS